MFIAQKCIAMSLEKNNSQRNIYLADDDDDDRNFFVEALLEIDNTVLVTQAEDGKQLMDILNTVPEPLPEILFLDINMPKLDGFECLQEIKRDNNLKKLFIIMLSTSSDPVTIDKALNLGATFYAVKPSTFEGLKTFIKNVLQMDVNAFDSADKKFRLV